MAHPKRKQWAEEMSKALSAPIYWDTDSTVWHTCRGAWSLAFNTSSPAKYHLVLQDDAVPCAEFRKNAQKFIKNIEEKFGEQNAFYFYFGNHNGFTSIDDEKEAMHIGHLKKTWGMNGVAICMRTELIPEMIRFGNGYHAWQDDEKIAAFLKSKNIDVYVPMPTLVDHRRKAENPSIIAAGRREMDRFSPWFRDSIAQKAQNQARLNENEPRLPLHQIWIGDKQKKPWRFMEGWQLPGFQYHLWTETELDTFFEKYPDNADAYYWYLERKIYHGAADIARYELLKQFGGLYIDADERRIANVEDFAELFVDTDFFAVEENQYGLIANGVLFAREAFHPIFEEWSNRIQKLPRSNEGLVPAWKKIGCVMLTDIYKTYQIGHNDSKAKILPQYSFFPVNAQKEKAPIVGKNYGEQFWGSTHSLYGTIGIRDSGVGHIGARGVRKYQ